MIETVPSFCPPRDFSLYIPITGCCNGSTIYLDVTGDEWESLNFGETPSRLADQMPPSCGWWRLYNPLEYDFNKRIVVPGHFDLPSEDVSRWAYLPDTDFADTSMGLPEWKKSHLLSLPKELRLEIWKWTLTDESVSNLVVNIGRKKSEAYQFSSTGAVIPHVTTWLEPKRNCPIDTAILRTNRFIYDEALPLLYRSARFAPADHQGIFPLFLDSLSPYARSLVRHVKLHVPRQIYQVDVFGGDPAVPLFHWAVTCAQVAKFDGQLRDVEVEGMWIEDGSMNARTRRSILHPLCKIKTKKVFGANNESGLEELLVEAAQQLKAKVALRKAEAEAKAVAQAAEYSSGDGDEAAIDEGKNAVQDFQELIEHTDYVTEDPMNDVERLMEDWDVVSYTSGASTPRGRPPSYTSRRSSESWTDAASSILEAQDLIRDEEGA